MGTSTSILVFFSLFFFFDHGHANLDNKIIMLVFLSKPSLFTLLSFIVYTVAFFSSNHRKKCPKHYDDDDYYLLSMKHPPSPDDGVTLELTKLLQNKEWNKQKSEHSTKLNFETILRTFDYANHHQTTSSHHNDTESIELEHLRVEVKESKCQGQNNQTTTELSPFYRRDRRDYEHGRNSDIIADPRGLQKLLQERFAARKARDFTKITNLDRQLKRDHGVRVSDYPRLWTTRTDASKASIRRRMRKRQARMKDLFGVRGHPYLHIQSPDSSINTSLLPESQVHNSLCQLTRYRMEGKYAEADAIKL